VANAFDSMSCLSAMTTPQSDSWLGSMWSVAGACGYGQVHEETVVRISPINEQGITETVGALLSQNEQFEKLSRVNRCDAVLSGVINRGSQVLTSRSFHT